MLDFLASPFFLGIIMMAGSCCFLLTVYFTEWGESGCKKFGLIVTRLTYSDKDQQSFVRFMWFLAWILGFAASLLIALVDPRVPHEFTWIFVNICWNLLLIVLLAKFIVLFCIAMRYLWFALVRIKEWIFNDKSLLSKAHQNKISPVH